MTHGVEALQAGSVGMINCLELAWKYKAKFLHASTSECYGDPLRIARSRHWALLFTDEASFRQDSTLHATWSRIGHPPEFP